MKHRSGTSAFQLPFPVSTLFADPKLLLNPDDEAYLRTAYRQLLPRRSDLQSHPSST